MLRNGAEMQELMEYWILLQRRCEMLQRPPASAKAHCIACSMAMLQKAIQCCCTITTSWHQTMEQPRLLQCREKYARKCCTGRSLQALCCWRLECCEAGVVDCGTSSTVLRTERSFSFFLSPNLKRKKKWRRWRRSSRRNNDTSVVPAVELWH